VDVPRDHLPPEHYNQIFSTNGATMVFFVAMPVQPLILPVLPEPTNQLIDQLAGGSPGRLAAVKHQR